MTQPAVPIPVQKIPLVAVARQFKSIESEIRGAMERVLARGDFVMGEDVGEFEREFAAFCGARDAVGVSNGTDALILALRAFEIGPGDEVITVPFTFAATVEAILTVGAKPVFVDIAPRSGLLDPKHLESACTSRTKAILPVHLFGVPCDMRQIGEFAQRSKILVIEDASQAHGAEFEGRRAGCFGDAATFSFYPAKNLGAFGEAGAVVTSNPQCAERVRLMRDHGSPDRYRHTILGWNCRLDTLQAAVLRVKLRHLEDWNARRRRIAEIYSESLRNIDGLQLPISQPGSKEVFHYYVIRSPRRDHIRERLAADGIASAIHYPIPLHLQEAFSSLGYEAGDFPQSEAWAREVLSLPAYPELDDGEVGWIAQRIRTALSKA